MADSKISRAKRYVPILKWKAGEYRALKDLTDEVRAGIRPLLEMKPLPVDFDSGNPAKTLQEHLEKVPSEILKHWGKSNESLLDLPYFQPKDRMERNVHPLTFLLTQGRRLGLKLIPVVTPSRDSQYQAAVKSGVKEDEERGLCIRLEPDDLADMDETGTVIETMLRTYEVGPELVDLVVDMKSVPNGRQFLPVALAALRTLPRVKEWRALTLVASSFPENMTGINRDTAETLPREEWTMWQAVRRGGKVPRVPAFGDYAIAHPDPFVSEIDPRLIRVSANIRYTTNDSFLILKGRSTRDTGFDQFRDLCKWLITQSEFKGAAFSAGDKFIYECARNPKIGPGNHTTWRSVGTNHHITLAFTQIASPSAP
jgi:ribosomal protein S19